MLRWDRPFRSLGHPEVPLWRSRGRDRESRQGLVLIAGCAAIRVGQLREADVCDLRTARPPKRWRLQLRPQHSSSVLMMRESMNKVISTLVGVGVVGAAECDRACARHNPRFGHRRRIVVGHQSMRPRHHPAGLREASRASSRSAGTRPRPTTGTPSLADQAPSTRRPATALQFSGSVTIGKHDAELLDPLC